VTWADGSLGAIAWMNNIDDPLTTYTPTIGGVTATLTYAMYKQIGKMVDVFAGYVLTGVPTAAQTITLPVAPHANLIGRNSVGEVNFFDQSTGARWQGQGIVLSGSTVSFYSTSGNQVGAATPFAFVATDSVWCSFRYPAA